MKKNGLKYIILLALILFFSVCFAFDYAWAKTYNIEVVSVSDTSPYADSKERVEIVVRVTHFGKAIRNHEIYSLPNAGSMVAYTTTTDNDGYATLTYAPYTATAFIPAKDVEIVIRDQSNSVFIEINASTTVTLNLRQKPKGKGK